MILPTSVDTSCRDYQRRLGYHRERRLQLLERMDVVRAGGGAACVDKERARGKMLVRERIEQLKDPGSFFLELSSLCGYELYPGVETPCGGIITGQIMVSGRRCMVIANDQTVKAGTYFPITIKKHLRALEVALQNRLPCIYLVDSGGLNLEYQAQAFADREHFGRIFYYQAQLNGAGIPQVASVHGSCTAGGAYIPAMSEQTIMVKGQGRIFLAGPELVRAATGEEVSAEDLGGWVCHGEHSGVVDYLADNDQHALAYVREVVAHFSQDPHRQGCHEVGTGPAPLYDGEEMLGVLPVESKRPWDMYEILARLLDGSEFFPFKESYGSSLITGWGQVDGISLGVVANRGVLFGKSAQKGTHFVDMCVQRRIPLLFVHNIAGFMVGREAERGGIAKEGAKMVHAVATAQVPKISLIVGGSHGAGNYAMCGRAFAGDFVFSWPSARTSVMGPAQAATVLASVKRGGGFAREDYMARFERESCPYYATARLWDDGLIDPLSTREVVAQAFRATSLRPQSSHDRGRGVIRM